MKSQILSFAALLLLVTTISLADEACTDQSTQTQENVPSCCSQTESKDAHKDCNHDKEDASTAGKSEQMDHQHHADVNQRGDEVMGFDHTKTTHHFYLKPDGGIIQVTANTSTDSDSRNKIRTHLQEISNRLKNGDFSPAKQIHGRQPDGAETMTQLKDQIQFEYEEVSDGARIVIKSQDEEARKAVHEFLKFQIQDHRTGDSVNVQP